MSETKRETVHKPSDDHGQEVTPYRVITPGGWLQCPENKGEYTGDNRPWRE
jgi:hypothetical protein